MSEDGFETTELRDGETRDDHGHASNIVERQYAMAGEGDPCPECDGFLRENEDGAGCPDCGWSPRVTLTVGAWVKDRNDLWHASTEFDGPSGVHALACEETLEAPAGVYGVELGTVEDHDDERCPDCDDAIAAADEVSGYV